MTIFLSNLFFSIFFSSYFDVIKGNFFIQKSWHCVTIGATVIVNLKINNYIVTQQINFKFIVHMVEF